MPCGASDIHSRPICEMNVRHLAYSSRRMGWVHTIYTIRNLPPLNLFLHLVGRGWFALIMHQHAGGDIVGMIILNLEVIDLDGAFEQLVLDFFNNDVFPVDKNQNISRAEVRSVRPALRRTIKRVRRRGNDLLTVDENMRQFIRFIDVDCVNRDNAARNATNAQNVALKILQEVHIALVPLCMETPTGLPFSSQVPSSAEISPPSWNAEITTVLIFIFS